MRSFILAATAAVLVPMAAPMAQAEGFSVRDLLGTTDRDECIRRGERAVQGLAKSGGSVDVTDWIIYGWDLGAGGAADLTLMCPIIAGGAVNGFLVVYSEGSEADRAFVADEVLRNF